MLGGEIYPVVNDNKVVDIEKYAIYINPDGIIKLDEQDFDSLFNTVISNGTFYIRDLTGEKEDIEITPGKEKEIFLSEEALVSLKKNKGLIYFKDVDDDTKLFEMNITNKELTQSLYDLMDLLNKKNEDGIEETINSIAQKFLDIVCEAKIDANVVAGELITNRLIRSAINRFERPDFTKDEIEPYNIVTVSYALEHNKSPLLGISFQDIKRQLLSDELYEERDGTSYLDPFYWTDIPTDNLKEYSKITTDMED